MANLTFTKTGDLYVATSNVSSGFNVHLEFDNLSDVVISVKTSGTRYSVVHAVSKTSIVDNDFDGIVYPKQVKIECTEEPTSAIMTIGS